VSFKVKKWGRLRTVNMQEFIPGLAAQTSNSRTYGWALAWQGKILVLAYIGDTAAWAVYDPATHTCSGPNLCQSPLRTYWGCTHPLWPGGFTGIGYCGNRYVYGYGRQINHYYAAGDFFGWDANFGFFDVRDPEGFTCYQSILTPGMHGDVPTTLHYCYTSTQANIVRKSPHGLAVAWSRPLVPGQPLPYAFEMVSGSRYHGMADMGGPVAWRWNGSYRLYAAPPANESEANNPLGTFNGPPPTSVGLRPCNGTLLAEPQGGGAWGMCDLGDGSAWRNLGSILTPAELPYKSWWHYYQAMDGGYELDEYDLDGTHHNATIDYYPLSESTSPVSYNADMGWYVALDASSNPLNFSVYVLDPFQPAGRVRNPTNVAKRSMAWAGDYAVRDDLTLQHVLPLPNGEVPSGGSLPPDERADGHILTRTGLYQRAGNAITYKRGIKVDMSSYPTSDPDWWFPGMEGTAYPGFWHLFGGSPIAIGRMPDPMWGMLNPLGQDVMYGLGAPTENLDAAEPAPTHVLRNTDRISGTTAFVTPSGDTQVLRRSLTDDRCSYCEFGLRFMEPPYWKARVGRVVGKAWTTLIDFNSLGLPGLGETDWTVWSVVPIPKCRSLPDGGWLVGATLYFDPWSSWEQTVGARTATFRYRDGTDSGRGWAPCRDGFIGPIETPEAFQPVYLAAYDEWTCNRSYYGPDVLLVYDNDGQLVECLNSPDIYPPDGWAVAVVPGTIPKVIYNVSRSWAYSDNAEGWGQYHAFAGDYDIQTPLFACYDLEDATGRLAPGMGTFRGFVDMHVVGDYDPKNAAWRWNTCAPTIYNGLYPNAWWAPGGRYRLGAGIGGTSITIMSPGSGVGRSGVKGVGRRA
jgi:hypothetical protein